jgi:hypothetical protein
MTACVNCARTLQPAWKYCIYCGTRTPVAAAATRSRPLPKRTPVPGYAAVSTGQTPIVPPPAPAPLSAAPVEDPVSSVWPDSLGERPSLRSALAATDIPAPTPPREDAPAPDGEEEPPPEDVEAIEPEAIEPEAIEPEAPEPEAPEEPEPFPAYDPSAFTPTDPEPEPVGEPEPRGRMRFVRRRAATASTTLLDEAPEIELDDDLEPLDETSGDRRGSVNTLSILALLIGLLACPFAALFGHIALGQLKVSGERGVIPAWIAIVLGYLWLGFWIVFAITYFATNG